MIKQKDISAIEQMQFNLMICFFTPHPSFIAHVSAWHA